MKDTDTVRFEVVKSESGYSVGVLRIHRPQALNALNHQVIVDFNEVLDGLEKDLNIRVLLLTGEGDKAFVAGADIKEMEALDPRTARVLSQNGQKLFARLQNLKVPVVAVINGFALGGGLELALACDFILASAKCKWGLPEVTLGLIPGYGGTQRLARTVGVNNARRVALSGEIFSAQQGYDWGLFSQLVEPEQLLPVAIKLADTLAARAPLAVAWVKEAVVHGFDKTLEQGLELESDLFARTFETKDRTEGVQAFMSKRPPKFLGH